MSNREAKELAHYHHFTRGELFDILYTASNSLPDSFWTKACKVNKTVDNGYYFNMCRDWVALDTPHNSDEVVHHTIAYRVLQVFGEFSPVQLPKKEKKKAPIEIKASAKPDLFYEHIKQ